MLTLDKQKVILWEAESIIDNTVVTYSKDNIINFIENYMQEEPYYGDPDYSFY